MCNWRFGCCGFRISIRGANILWKTSPVRPTSYSTPYMYIHLYSTPQSHQLAFFTPGMLPSRAFNRNWNRAIRKSLNTPLPFPAIIHRFFIWVGLVCACMLFNCNCAFRRCTSGSCVLRAMNLQLVRGIFRDGRRKATGVLDGALRWRQR